MHWYLECLEGHGVSVQDDRIARLGSGGPWDHLSPAVPGCDPTVVGVFSGERLGRAGTDQPAVGRLAAMRSSPQARACGELGGEGEKLSVLRGTFVTPGGGAPGRYFGQVY